jgi:PhnB protein
MASKAKPIPDDSTGATPYLSVKGASDAIEFYENAFGATEIFRIADATGKVGHAELKIGKALVMIADEFPEEGHLAPKSLGGTPVAIHIYVEDVDALAKRAVAAGATIKKQPEDQFYGDRVARLEDPFGHAWLFATRKEDVTPDEMKKRAAALFGG